MLGVEQSGNIELIPAGCISILQRLCAARSLMPAPDTARILATRPGQQVAAHAVGHWNWVTHTLCLLLKIHRNVTWFCISLEIIFRVVNSETGLTRINRCHLLRIFLVDRINALCPRVLMFSMRCVLMFSMRGVLMLPMLCVLM